MEYRVKKPIVIPKGTIFYEDRESGDHYTERDYVANIEVEGVEVEIKLTHDEVYELSEKSLEIIF